MRRKLRNTYYFNRQKLKGKFRTPHPDPLFLFVLAGPRTASTLLSDIINTSENVSRNNPIGEGRMLPGVSGRYGWRPIEPDWQQIKSLWMEYWDRSRPVLLEKSPPNLIHAEAIQKVFDPSYFVCLVRNPYAQSESLIRRTGYTPREAAEFALECLRLQKQNLESLDHAYLIRYEDLTEDPALIAGHIRHWIPQVGNLNLKGEFGYSGIDEIRNTNAEKIARFHHTQLSTLTETFKRNATLLRHFRYSLIDVVKPVPTKRLITRTR